MLIYFSGQKRDDSFELTNFAFIFILLLLVLLFRFHNSIHSMIEQNYQILSILKSTKCIYFKYQKNDQ